MVRASLVSHAPRQRRSCAVPSPAHASLHVAPPSAAHSSHAHAAGISYGWTITHWIQVVRACLTNYVMHHRAASSDGLSSVVPSRANVLLHTNNCYAFSQSLHCKYQGPYVSSKIWRLMCKMESESATSCDATPCCSLPWTHVCIHAPCVVPPLVSRNIHPPHRGPSTRPASGALFEVVYRAPLYSFVADTWCTRCHNRCHCAGTRHLRASRSVPALSGKSMG